MLRLGTLSDLPAAWARLWPESLACADLACQRSFAQLERASRRWANALLRAGLGPGTRVSLWAGNSPRWLERAFGVWRAGATLVPLSTFATARELEEILQSAQPQALLLDASVGRHDLLTVWEQTRPHASLAHVVIHDGGNGRPRARGWQERDFLNTGSSFELPLPAPRSEAEALLLYTSGTTGKPKGVRLSHGAVLATIAPTVERGGLVPGDRLYSSLPLFWVAGLVIRALPTLASGAALLLSPTFCSAECWEMLRRFRANGLHLRPPQVAALLADSRFDPALLRRVTKGGGRSAWYGDHLREARLITGYGMTEMSGYVTCTDHRDPEHIREESIGTPLPSVEIRIVDANGKDLPSAQVGEIRVRGPGLFLGYEGMPAGAGLDERGFFCTGDLGFWDPAGRLRFTGRSKDLLRVKGVNVSPLEVEEVLARHPSVDLAYVVGLPVDALDQELVAVVVPRAGSTNEDSWRAWCEHELSVYKRPARYVVVAREELPFGPTAKPQRAEIARLAQQKLAS